MIEDDSEVETTEEEGQEIGEETPQEAIAFQDGLPDDAVNLVPYFTEQGVIDPKVADWLTKELPNQICDDFKEDWDSCEEWRKRRADRRKLFLGHLQAKKEPFANCANGHMPILLERILRLAHRVYAELCPERAPMFQAITPLESNDAKQRVDLITLHDNWQFTKESPNFKKQLRKALTGFFLDGEIVFHSYYDQDKERNIHEYLTCEEFVFQYVWKTDTIDMSDVPRKTKILRRHDRDLRRGLRKGIYSNVESILGEKDKGDYADTEMDNVVKDVLDGFEGIEKGSSPEHVLLEQHTYVEIPGMEDEVPVIVTIDYRTKTILNIRLREYDDPEDRIRFDRETQEFEGYLNEVTGYLAYEQEKQKTLSSLQQPGVDPYEAQALAQHITVTGQDVPPPNRPQWVQLDEQQMPKPPAPCKKKIIEQFSHGVCIENPEGSHGLGVGTVLMPFQEASNILLSQAIDVGTLENSKGGFIHESARLPPGVSTMSPNEWIPIKGIPVEDFTKAFVDMKRGGGNPQMLEFLKIQINSADGVASAPDVLSGEKDGPETFRGQQSRVEQAVKQLTVFAGNVIEVLGNIIKNNATLNFQFLPDYKLVSVIDPKSNQFMNIEVSRELYRDEYATQFTSDLRFASKAQRIAEADDVLGMLTQGIPPEIAPKIMKLQAMAEAVRSCLRARGVQDMLSYVFTDEQIDQALQEERDAAAKKAAMMAPPGPGGTPGMPAPSIPTGSPDQTPGVKPPSGVPDGSSAEGAPGQ
jgi:hypothetical protein